MAPKEPELQIKTSMKNAGSLIRTILTGLGALGLGAAGSVLTSSSDASAQEARVTALEESCQRYEVRLSTQETETNNLKASYADIKKDLAEIRGTSTQILFELQKDKHK